MAQQQMSDEERNERMHAPVDGFITNILDISFCMLPGWPGLGAILSHGPPDVHDMNT